MCRSLRVVPLVVSLLVSAWGPTVRAGVQEPDELRQAIDRLGDFDHAVRMEASRILRRADRDVVGPLLLEAGRTHADSYVQFRAVVLAYGLNLPGIHGLFRDALESSNDRVRAAAYEYFEQVPSQAVVPSLLAALDTETSEFVRPYLVRALAANDDLPEVRERLIQDIDRGQGYFRGAVIEALGDYRAEYAVEPLIRITSEDGPLRDDALLALGKIGDGRAMAALRRLQADAEQRLQPVISATACLLGVDCDGQLRYVIDALAYGARRGDDDGQQMLRSASAALAALAMAGNSAALSALFDVGVSASDSARAPIAIAIGTVAFRQPSIVREALQDLAQSALPEAQLLLIRDAFDLLDEDFAEERFFVMMRGTYWASAESSLDRSLAEAALRVLEF